jgi:hypothetical protein
VDLAIDTAGSGIAIVTRTSDAGLEAELTGSAELPAAEVMNTIVQALHERARTLAVTTVVMDFTNLEFMNSSCFKSLVTWVNEVSELDEARRYKIRFRTNAGIPWQRRSLHALKTMATDIITVET